MNIRFKTPDCSKYTGKYKFCHESPCGHSDCDHAKNKALPKLRTALMFWLAFRRNARFNHHTLETIEITIKCVKYVIDKAEKGEIDMELIDREGK